MKNTLISLIYLFCSFLIMPVTAISQKLIWEYEVETPYRNTPRHFWVDQEGNGYYNMNREDPKKPSSNYTHYFLLSLDAQGKFQGANHVNECASPTDLLPFGNDHFVSSGNNCINKRQYNRDTKVLNKNGDVIKTGKAFPGTYHAKIKGENGYTFFSDKNGFKDFETMTIGHIDWDFNFSAKTISLESLKIDSLGIVNNFRDPAKLSNGTWVAPFNYGKMRNEYQVSIQHGMAVGIVGNKIAWTYPSTINSYVLEQLSAYENRLAIIMKSKKEGHLFVLLDQNGNILLEKSINIRTIKDVILDKTKLIILTKHSIDIFDLGGHKLSSSQEYQEDKLVLQHSMALLEDGDLIITGIRDNNSVFRRVSFKKEEIEDKVDDWAVNNQTNQEPESDEVQIVETETEEEEIEIESAVIEEVAEETISVSVYPNPASLFINFDIAGNGSSEFLIQIIDVSGKVIFSDQFSDTRYELLLSDFPSGTYFYRIADKNKPDSKILSGKFVRVY